MAAKIVPIKDIMIDEAAALLANHHARDRQTLPEMPDRYEDPAAARRAIEAELQREYAMGFVALSDGPDDDYFADGDSIMFSIAPIAGLFDGGEIWVWTKAGAAPAVFLDHGCDPHKWNTAHDVKQHFALGAGGEDLNINALEALPEPTALSLFALGGLALLRRRSRQA